LFAWITSLIKYYQGKVSAVAETWQELLEQLLLVLGKILEKLVQDALAWSLLIVWLAWSLWGINWKKVWPVLAQGAWVSLVLVIVLVALVWSQMYPGECEFLGLWQIPNFAWQLAAVGMVVAATLFCGWLQGVMSWQPAEISLEPPAATAHGQGNH
jgi:hypothetical protein